jgi:hypothetical protein
MAFRKATQALFEEDENELVSVQSELKAAKNKFKSELKAAKFASSDLESSLEIERESHLITQTSLYSLQYEMKEIAAREDSHMVIPSPLTPMPSPPSEITSTIHYESTTAISASSDLESERKSHLSTQLKLESLQS